jgi:hypothetical protein
MSSRTKTKTRTKTRTKKYKKQNQKTGKSSKSKRQIPTNARKYSKKNRINRKINLLLGGALPVDDLIAIIESELGKVLDNETKQYYKARYESFKSEEGQEKEFATIIEEIRNQMQIERSRKANISAGAAAASARPVALASTRYSNSTNAGAAVARQVFTLITTGLSNWGSEHNIITFYGLIMESLILNTFFGNVAKFNIHHYDSNLSPEQNDLIKDKEKELTDKYGILIESQIYRKDLEPRESTLQVPGLNSRNCLHLDFANLDFAESEEQKYRDSFLTINSIPIKKVYFGYWEPSYPSEYADVIRSIKLVEIRPDGTLETFADKFIQLGILQPILFYPITECADTPRNVITIPGIRTMYQAFGIDPRELFRQLWVKPSEYMRTWLAKTRASQLQRAAGELVRIYTDRTPNPRNKCLFCPIRKCLSETDVSVIAEHPRLCRICYNLMQPDGRVNEEKFEKEMNKNTPPAS